MFTAISDPSRRRIIELLADRQLSVTEVAQAFEMSRPAVSKHLRILKEAGVVADDAAGRERFYRLQPDRLDDITAWITTYQHFWRERMTRLARTTRRLANEQRR